MNETVISHAPQAAGPAATVRVQEPQAGRVLARTFPHTTTSTRRRSSIISGSRNSRSRRPTNCSRRSRTSARRSSIDDAEAGFQAGADGGARFAVRDLAHRLERSGQRSDPPPVRSARLRAAARSSAAHARFAARAGRFAGSRARPPLRRQGAVPSAQHVSRSTAASARAATRSAPTPRTSIKSRLPRRPSSGRTRSQYIAARPELEDIVISGGDAYQLPPKNHRSSSATRCSTSRTCAACASRPKARRSCR